MEATGVNESSLSRLRGWNLGLALLHGLQVVVVLVLANDFAITVTSSFPQGPPGTVAPAPEALFDVRVGVAIAVFLLLRGHRERPGDEAGQPGDPDGADVGRGTGDGEDEAHIGHEAVVDAEHGGPGRTPVDGRGPAGGRRRRPVGDRRAACRARPARSTGRWGRGRSSAQRHEPWTAAWRSASTSSAWAATSVTS